MQEPRGLCNYNGVLVAVDADSSLWQRRGDEWVPYQDSGAERGPTAKTATNAVGDPKP